MGCMPNSLSGTKSLKNAIAFRKRRNFHHECRFYIFSYIFLVYHTVYVLRHLNYAKCPCLSVSRIFLDLNIFFPYYLDFFCEKHVFFSVNADFTYLAIYYNLII